jgi:3-hydroxyanthranilate 3,4-dioxygenase
VQVVGDVIEDGRPAKIPVKEGEIVLLPRHYRHSPQRPQPGSVGLVVEKIRPRDVDDAFEWYCPGAGRACIASRRKCPQCGRIHPGKG